MLNITSWIPTFDHSMDKGLRRKSVARYALFCFIFSAIWIIIIIPAYNILCLKPKVFKYIHRWRIHVRNNYTGLHSLPFYHNRSLRLFTFWSLVILTFSLFKDYLDLIQITKRLGRISAALLPTILFLTLRPSPLPKILYLTVLPLHKWMSRALILAALLHSVLYVAFFIYKGTFNDKMWKLANIYGLIALMVFGIIIVSSLKMVRRSNYRVFYYLHYSMTWLSIILIHFHARPRVTMYTILSLFILCYQIIYRLYHTTIIKPSFTRVSPTLTLMEFPMNELYRQPDYPSSHIRVQIKSKNKWKMVLNQLLPLTHPFTLLNLPNEGKAQILIRNGNFSLISNAEYYITGPYEPTINFLTKSEPNYNFISPFQVLSPQLRASPQHYTVSARRVLIFVGGSAISFGLPLLSILNFNGVMVRLIWVVRDYQDLKLLNYLKKNHYQGMEIYITGKVDSLDGEENINIDYYDSDIATDDIESTHDQPLLNNNNNLTNYSSNDSRNDEIDFTNTNFNSPLVPPSPPKITKPFRDPLTVSPPIDASDIIEIPNRIKVPSYVKIFYGRPQLTNSYYEWCLQRECASANDLNDEQCVEPDLQTDEDALSTVWVVAAGPMGLVKTTKKWADDCGLRFHGEEFTL